MDLSKCEICEKSKNGKITYYIYSKEKRDEDGINKTYHYNYDNLSEYEKRDAKILLFTGKTGDGKSTAINAFFNIIKGVKLEDNYRLFLIREDPKKKGESMTEGLHLYYLRDYKQKPIIIIDSQGFGDTRGVDKDMNLNKTFAFVFSSIIDHINAICFIAKASDARLPVDTKYIISCVTSLFSDDVTHNFFILATHPDEFALEDGEPKFLESIEGDDTFLKIKKNMREKFWYMFDSLYVLRRNSPHCEMLKYSFEQLTYFYEEELKKCFNVNIKQSAEVLNNRLELIVKSNVLMNKFQDLNQKQKNLNEDLNAFTESNNQFEKLKQDIADLTEKIQNTDKTNDTYKELLLNAKGIRAQMKDICEKQTKPEYYQKLESTSKRYTYCTSCEKNCHDPCDCWLTSLGRCKKFTIIGCLHLFDKENHCEECKCGKSRHEADNHRYVPAIREVPVDNSENLDIIKKSEEKEDKVVNSKIEKNNQKLDEEKKALIQLENDKKNCEKIKEKNKKKYEKTEEVIKENKIEIFRIILEIMKISKLLEKTAMNKSNINNQLDYFENLKYKLEQIGDSENEQRKKIDEFKKLYDTFMKYNNLDIDSLENMSEEDIRKEALKYFSK